MNYHRIQENDSPMSIAYQHTGDYDRYWELLVSNPNIPIVSINHGYYSVQTFDPRYFNIGGALTLPDSWFGPKEDISKQTSTELGVSGVGNGTLGNPDSSATSWEAADIIIGMATLTGNVGGGMYAYHAKGGFWWTLLGILVGGAAGNLTGRLVTLPLRK